MERKRLSVLGSTGSIGTQTLDVAKKRGYSVCALAARGNIKRLEQQARQFLPRLVCVYDENCYRPFKQALADTDIRVTAGEQGLCEAAAAEEADTVVNAVVGMVGLKPTMAAISAGKDVALANKETLVTGGSLVIAAARERGVNILPVDSEHSAIFQCLQGSRERELKRILLTASGGPFYGKTREELAHVTVEDALKHPNWDMGAKITTDSATLMNKGLELIEAVWLFGCKPEQIEILVHRESVIHSGVEFVDNAVICQLGVPDMRLPIQYALTYPERVESPCEQLDLLRYGTLSFAHPDEETFLCLKAAKQAIVRGGLYPAMVNGANEAAVALFLDHKISFLQIGELVTGALSLTPPAGEMTVERVYEADALARGYVLDQVNQQA